MRTENTSSPLNTFPFLNEDVERMLRLRAWKDETFREALIANPKGVIQQLFPQCFPNGELPEQLTIKVIEEDPDTCHIVVPLLPDEFQTPEIPEEEHLELFAHMGSDRTLGKRDASEKRESQSSGKCESDFTKESFKRKEEAEKQEIASKPLTSENLQKDIVSLAKKDENFHKRMVEASKETSPEKRQVMLRNTLQEYFPHYLNGSNGSERQTFKVTQDAADTHHIVLAKLPDASHDPAAPEDKQRQFGFTDGCSYGCTRSCATPRCSTYKRTC